MGSRKRGGRFVVTRYVDGRVHETLGSYYYKRDAERNCPQGFVVIAR